MQEQINSSPHMDNTPLSFKVGFFTSQAITTSNYFIKWSCGNYSKEVNNTWLDTGFSLENGGTNILCPKTGLMYLTVQLAFDYTTNSSSVPFELAINNTKTNSLSRLMQVVHYQSTPCQLSGIVYVDEPKSLCVEVRSKNDSFTLTPQSKVKITSRSELPLSFFCGYYI